MENFYGVQMLTRSAINEAQSYNCASKFQSKVSSTLLLISFQPFIHLHGNKDSFCIMRLFLTRYPIYEPFLNHSQFLPTKKDGFRTYHNTNKILLFNTIHFLLWLCLVHQQLLNNEMSFAVMHRQLFDIENSYK